MTNMTISNPGVGRLFSGFAEALAGTSPEALISADYKRTQRDNLQSDTSINRQTLTVKQRQEAAMSQLAEVLADPSSIASPGGRAGLMSVLSQVPDGMELGPTFAAGAASFTDPDFVHGDEDYSRVLAGTGVQPNWGHTPTGYSDHLSTDLTLEKMRQMGETARAAPPSPGIGTHANPLPCEWGDPPGRTVDTGLGDALAPSIDWAGELRASLQRQFPNVPISAQLVQSLIPRASEIYKAGAYPQEGLTFGQGPGGIAVAVTRAISEMSPAVTGHRAPRAFSAWNPFDWGGDPGAVEASPVGAPQAGVAAADAPTHPIESLMGSIFEGLAYSGLSGAPMLGAAHRTALPPAPIKASNIQRELPIWGEAPAASSTPPERFGSPLPDGPAVGHDPEAGYYMVEAGRRVPLYRGSVIESKSTGMRAVFFDGQWFPAPAP